MTLLPGHYYLVPHAGFVRDGGNVPFVVSLYSEFEVLVKSIGLLFS